MLNNVLKPSLRNNINNSCKLLQLFNNSCNNLQLLFILLSKDHFNQYTVYTHTHTHTHTQRDGNCPIFNVKQLMQLRKVVKHTKQQLV